MKLACQISSNWLRQQQQVVIWWPLKADASVSCYAVLYWQVSKQPTQQAASKMKPTWVHWMADEVAATKGGVVKAICLQANWALQVKQAELTKADQQHSMNERAVRMCRLGEWVTFNAVPRPPVNVKILRHKKVSWKRAAWCKRIGKEIKRKHNFHLFLFHLRWLARLLLRPANQMSLRATRYTPFLLTNQLST